MKGMAGKVVVVFLGVVVVVRVVVLVVGVLWW